MRRNRNDGKRETSIINHENDSSNSSSSAAASVAMANFNITSDRQDSKNAATSNKPHSSTATETLYIVLPLASTFRQDISLKSCRGRYG